jgi:hypothetical protein
MKTCPLKVDEDACEQCHWNFGHDRCAIFSIAVDLSVLAEESVKQTKFLERIAFYSAN